MSKRFFDFIVAGHITINIEFCLQEKCSYFEEIYPEYDFNNKYPTKRFSKWLQLLPELHLSFAGYTMRRLRKNNNEVFYIFSG